MLDACSMRACSRTVAHQLQYVQCPEASQQLEGKRQWQFDPQAEQGCVTFG